MRIQVILPIDEQIALPINQNYFLSSAIYHALDSHPDYARFLHEYGYLHSESGRHFKLFVFSPLICKNRKLNGDKILLGPGRIRWTISSPMVDFVVALAEGLLYQGRLPILDVSLPIKCIETEPNPLFENVSRFSSLSPIVVARDNGDHAHFCTQEDPEFSERIRKNLIRKYELIHKQPPSDSSLHLEFDPQYLSHHGGKITKLIDIRHIKIRGVQAPFTVTGSPELTKVGYECGFGERGSMGFGCVNYIHPAVSSSPNSIAGSA